MASHHDQNKPLMTAAGGTAPRRRTWDADELDCEHGRDHKVLSDVTLRSALSLTAVLYRAVSCELLLATVAAVDHCCLRQDSYSPSSILASTFS